MVADKVVAFRNSIDTSLKETSASFKEYVEDALKISSQDYTNLNVLKYHIETETTDNRDEALKFLNLLQDCYDGRTIDMSIVGNLQDLYMGKEGGATGHNILRMLMQNAGILTGIINEAWYMDNRFYQVSSAVTQNRDGSFTRKVTSYEELKNFLAIVCKNFSFAFTSARQKELQIKIGFLEDMDFSIPSIVCFANITKNTAKYTIFEQECQAELGDTSFFLETETEYKEVFYNVWAL